MNESICLRCFNGFCDGHAGPGIMTGCSKFQELPSVATALAMRAENARLRRALTASGIPAQAALDDLAPPLKINTRTAKEIMEMVDG